MNSSGKISSKPYKQWCKARGLDFNSYISQFPLVANRLGIVAINKPTLEPLQEKPTQEKPKGWVYRLWQWIIHKLKNKR